MSYLQLLVRSSFSLAQAQAQAQKAGLPTLNFSKLKPTGYDFETTLSARGSITARARGAYAAAQQVQYPSIQMSAGYFNPLLILVTVAGIVDPWLHWMVCQ
jgi:hypothetical protein